MYKSFWVATIRRFILALAVIFVIGVLLDAYQNARDARNPFSAGSIMVGIYLGLSIALYLTNAVIEACYLYLFSEKDFTAACLADLRQAKLPPPTEWQSKNYNFLLELADDEGANPSDRVRAAVLYGAYKTVIAQTVFRGIAFRNAVDRAVMTYANETPKRQVA